MRTTLKISLTLFIAAAAVAAGAYKYRDYLAHPWTRDGQVRANVIEIAPRVSGPIVELPIVDNQAVTKDDLLFRIDPRTFETRVALAQAALDETLDQLDSLERQVDAAEARVEQAETRIAQAEAQVRSATATLDEAARNLERFEILLSEGNIAQARFDAQRREFDVDAAAKDRADAALAEARAKLVQAQADLAAAVATRGAEGEDNAQLQAAQAQFEEALLDLEFTEQRAPVNGFVTNLMLDDGSHATANQPVMALVDAESFWVDAYFRETAIGELEPGDPAFVTLMSYPDVVIEGEVESIAWGIARQDSSTGTSLLPNVQPTFEWIRLAQRIPVRIALDALPDGVDLRVGTTASVMVRSRPGDDLPPPVPSLLQ